jgi:hypothetical protein
MCSFCGRPRTLRNEQHQLGALVRTIVTCETCHRTLSSSIAVAAVEPVESESIAVEAEATPETAASTQPVAKASTQRKPKPTAAKATTSKTRVHKKTR